MKDEALAFYRGVTAHGTALKDKYRNSVMHARASFNEHEARDAMEHTRSFMNTISKRVSEKTKKEIKWKF